MVDDKLVSRSFWVGDIKHVRIVPTILVLWQRGYCGVLLILFSEVQFLLTPFSVLIIYILKIKKKKLTYKLIINKIKLNFKWSFLNFLIYIFKRNKVKNESQIKRSIYI